MALPAATVVISSAASATLSLQEKINILQVGRVRKHAQDVLVRAPKGDAAHPVLGERLIGVPHGVVERRPQDLPILRVAIVPLRPSAESEYPRKATGPAQP